MAGKTDLAASLDRGSRRQRDVVTDAPAVPAESSAAPAAPPAVPAGVGKTRIVVDLVRPEYRDFARWREDVADEFGWSRVTGADVLRVLIRKLLTDDALASDVKEQLRREGAR